MKRLEGKVALVTSGSRGIGAAIARRLAEEGARLVVSYARDEAAAARVSAEINEKWSEAAVVQADVRQAEGVERLFTRAQERFGRLDIVVQNAGVFGLRPLGQIDEAHVSDMLDINVRSVIFGLQEAARVLGPGGRIISLSSVLARQPSPGTLVYAASKAAVEALTRAAAVELAPRGITVNAVAPGLTDTDMVRGNLPPDVIAAAASTIPLGRIARPDDIADVVVFLASDAARWLTGQVLEAGGGACMS